MSKPGRYLLFAALFIVGFAPLLPFSRIGTLFGFTRLPLLLVSSMLIIVGVYILAAEALKRLFYERVKY